MIGLKVWYGGNSEQICFDTDEGFDLLQYQIISIFPDFTEYCGEGNSAPLIIDSEGRFITSAEDIISASNHHTQVVESATTTDSKADSLVELWCMHPVLNNLNQFCTSELLKINDSTATDCIQVAYRLVDTTIRLCGRCKSLFDPSLIVPDTAELYSFACENSKAIDTGLAPPGAAEQLHIDLVKLSAIHVPLQPLSPITLYLKRKLLDEAVDEQYKVIQRLLPLPIPPLLNMPAMENLPRCPAEGSFEARLASGCKTVLVYEDPAQQEKARNAIDYAKVKQNALEYIEEQRANATNNSGGDNNNNNATNTGANASTSPVNGPAEDVALMMGLLRWFKQDFFRWCNKPECENPHCGARAARMQSLGVQAPTDTERAVGWAGRTEIYRCQECDSVTRFPRYNNPSHLLTTRRGRCGEWANAFCLICRSLSFDARWVLDFTDHVWVEVWIPSMQRYVHADPCERRLDAPLLYESGWGKKLTHVISFSRHGVADASPRYSRKLTEVILRRSFGAGAAASAGAGGAQSEAVSEKFVAMAIKRFDLQQENQFVSRSTLLQGQNNAATTAPMTPVMSAAVLTVDGFGLTAAQDSSRSDISIATMKERKKLLARELSGLMLLTNPTDPSTSDLCGRISGDQEWINSRGEGGAADGSGGNSGNGNCGVKRKFKFPERKDNNSKDDKSKVNKEEIVANGDDLVRPWLIPGVLCSQSLLKKKDHKYIDICASSYGYKECQSDAVIPNKSPTESVFPSSHLGPLFSSAQFGLSIGVQYVSSGLRGDDKVTFLPSLSLVADNIGDSNAAVDEGECSTEDSTAPMKHQDDTVDMDKIICMTRLEYNEDADTGNIDNNDNNSKMQEDQNAAEANSKSSGIAGSNAMVSLRLPCAPSESQFIEVTIKDSKSTGDSKESAPSCVIQTSPSPVFTKAVDSNSVSSTNARVSEGGLVSLRVAAVDGWGPVRVRARQFFSAPPSPSQLPLVLPNTAAVDTTTTASAATAVTAATAAAQQGAISLRHVSGDYVCSVPSHFLFLDEKERNELSAQSTSASQPTTPATTSVANVSYLSMLVKKAHHYCLQEDVNSMGFSIIDGKTPESSFAAVFGETGFPLRACTGCTTYVKTIERAIEKTLTEGGAPATHVGTSSGLSQSSSQSPESPSPVILLYLPLGGGHHGDTLPFDGTQFLWPMMDFLAEGTVSEIETERDGKVAVMTAGSSVSSALWSALRLEELMFWAGTTLVNGVQASYTLPNVQAQVEQSSSNCATSENAFVRFKSPLFSSTHDDPIPHILKIAPDDRVAKVGIRSGSLVDSITITLQSGVVFKCGGNGGGDGREVEIPVGWRLVGFYGGTGGHLHNIGVVIMRDFSVCRDIDSKNGTSASPLSPASFVLTDTTARLVSLLSRHEDIWSCRFLNSTQHMTTQRRHTLVGAFLTLIRDVYCENGGNQDQSGKTCLETIALYTENILKNPADKRCRKIKSMNAFLARNVLIAKQGLALLCFGPASFRFLFEGAQQGQQLSTNAVLETSVSLFAEGGDVSRDEWVTALKSYATFLRAAIEVLYNK